MSKLKFLMIFLVITQLSFAQEDRSVKKWQPNWESLRSRPYPKWFNDAKLGIFIHWGVTAVPSYSGKESYGEWYLRGLQVGDSLRTNFMKNNYGKDFTYKDFGPLFKAELFDPAEWAEIFKRAGAKYVILVSKHHDGYCLWPSKYSTGWNSMDVGPHRDLVGDLTKAVRGAGLKMGLYYSLPEWNHPLHRWYTDPHDSIGTYVDQHMIPQFKELISTYKPSLIFSDGEWYNSAEQWHSAELIAWYFNLVGDEAIVNNRWGRGSKIGFLTPEYSAGIKKTDRPWAEVRGLGRSFGLNRNEKLDAYMKAEDLIHFFVKAVSNGGGITINVGPKADGQIPLLQQDRLVKLGEWLKINGEAIYASDTWEKPGEFREYTLERIDPNLSFWWVRNTPGKPIREDHFTAEWTGFIEPKFNEEYTFTARADDGFRLWIDGKLVINQWEESKKGTDSQVMGSDLTTVKDGKLSLTADRRYIIRAEFYEKTHQAGLALSWESKSQKKQIIPESAFYTENRPDAQHGLQGIYRSEGQYLGYTVKDGNVYAIILEWPGKELVLPIDLGNRDVKISLLGWDGTLEYKSFDKKIHIDLSNIYHNDLPCLYAWTFKIEGLN